MPARARENTSIVAVYKLTVLWALALITLPGPQSVHGQDKGSAAAPIITGLSPESGRAGGAAFSMIINGKHFVPGATTAKWNTSTLNITFKNAAQLIATVPAKLIAVAGTAFVRVSTKTGTSTPVTFKIIPKPPAITELYPSSAIAGGTKFTLVIMGKNFVSGATSARWDSTALKVSVKNSTQLSVEISAGLIAMPGTVGIVVSTRGGTSTEAKFSIVLGRPGITSLK